MAADGSPGLARLLPERTADLRRDLDVERAGSGVGVELDVVAGHHLGVAERVGLSDAQTLDVQLPASGPPPGADLVGVHWSHPSCRQAIRLIVLATTPADTVTCRGIFALCFPHGQIHFTWPPVAALTKQPARVSARLTSRSCIGFATKPNLYPLDVTIKPG